VKPLSVKDYEALSGLILEKTLLFSFRASQRSTAHWAASQNSGLFRKKGATGVAPCQERVPGFAEQLIAQGYFEEDSV